MLDVGIRAFALFGFFLHDFGFAGCFGLGWLPLVLRLLSRGGECQRESETSTTATTLVMMNNFDPVIFICTTSTRRRS